jgi:predicted HTH transcriptional regulator
MGPTGFTKTIKMPNGQEITLNTGRYAKQADGSVMLRCGDTVLLNDPKDDPKNLSERQKLIMQIISEDRTITRQQLAQRTNISDSTIKREIAQLKELGYIERIGEKTFGHWECK